MTRATVSRPVFITGGTGYLGTRLVPRLLERGHEVRALVREGAVRNLPIGCQSVTGNALDARTIRPHLRSGDSFIQLVGVPKPAPWKGPAFRAVDLVSGLASVAAAKQGGVHHFIYVSVAHPAPIMKDYIAVRRECEAALRATEILTTIVRPWYILGPGHWWPYFLKPGYWIAERVTTTRDAALRLGLVTLEQMLTTLVWAVEHPPESVRIMEVPDIRTAAIEQS